MAMLAWCFYGADGAWQGWYHSQGLVEGQSCSTVVGCLWVLATGKFVWVCACGRYYLFLAKVTSVVFPGGVLVQYDIAVIETDVSNVLFMKL